MFPFFFFFLRINGNAPPQKFITNKMMKCVRAWRPIHLITKDREKSRKIMKLILDCNYADTYQQDVCCGEVDRVNVQACIFFLVVSYKIYKQI